MNAYPYTANFIGATGEYPINEYINKVEINSSNFTLLNSNILNTKIFDTSNILNTKTIDTSNILQGQITATSNLIYKDEDRNTIVKISAQNPEYPLIGDPVEMRFQNVNNEYLTKIIQTGELYVYHPVSVIPLGYGPSWWNVEGKLSFAIQETIGLRFDVTQLQATTGTSDRSSSGCSSIRSRSSSSWSSYRSSRNRNSRRRLWNCCCRGCSWCFSCCFRLSLISSTKSK